VLNIFPSSIYISACRLIVYRDIDDKDSFIDAHVRTRNLFSDNFGDSSSVTPDSTRKFLSQFNADNDSRILYGVYYRETLIGQYGLKLLQPNAVLLDNAMRFMAIGPRGIFFDIGKWMVSHVISTYRNTRIYISVAEDNTDAMKIHQYGSWVLTPAGEGDVASINRSLRTFRFVSFASG